MLASCSSSAPSDALPLTDPVFPTRSPKRTHGTAPTRPRSPLKLTPLERKDRDRQRQKEQAQRRLQAIKDRDAQAVVLLAGQHKCSLWHRQERQEEELVLRRLERDLVDAQRCHPAAAGYRFSSARHACNTTVNSPVFVGYSPAMRPPSQARNYPTKTPAAAVTHPAFTNYCVTKHNDATALSPVFFFVRYAKIPLEEVNMDDDDDAKGGSDEDASDDDDALQTHEQFLARQQLRDGPGAGRIATITKLAPVQQLELQETLRGRFVVDACAKCLVCRGRAVVGCSGCFEFSHRTYQKVQSAKSTQRLKTPKTHRQEASERQARYTGLRLKLMGFGRRSEENRAQEEGNEVDGDDDEESREPKQRRPMTSEQRDYYVNVLTNVHAVRKHRALMKNYVTLHIKTLPVGNLITLQVDARATIAYVYELYRSHLDAPNRKVHLLLPTTAGLFYLNELMESATDTRCGLVNGEFLVDDFQLRATSVPPPASPLAKRNALREAATQQKTPIQTEFLLFSVAILSEHNTPQLVANFMQHNFHFDDDVVAHPHDAGDLHIEYAIARLPHVAIGEDAYQKRLVPHVHRMQEFAKVAKQLELLEQERERERVLWVAYQERKLARLAHQKKQRLLAQGSDGRRSRKVTRAMAYLDFCLESTSNASRARVWEERLQKLWQCAQRLEEWKLCKHGRLVDAECTADTRALVQRLLDATVAAFDKLLARAPGAGPLVYPIQCIGANSGAQPPKLVVKIGLRLGCSPTENYEYGLVLDVEQDFEAMAAATTVLADDDRRRMKTRGFTKKQLVALSDEAATRDEGASSWRCADCEWKPKPGAETALLFAGSDLVRMPFLQFPWHVIMQAYKCVLESLAFQLAKLDEFNALAKLLQQEDAQLGKAQIAKWGDDVQRFQSGLSELAGSGNGGNALIKGSALLRATQRVLDKKGVALLKKRLRQRRQRMREREQELERLRELQEANATPKKSVVELLKLHFIQEKAPKINAILEPTPAEKLLAKAEQLLGAVAAKASSAATAAKKEYDVRTL